MAVVSTHEAVTHEMHGASFTPLVSPRRGTEETSVWRVRVAPGTPATPHEVTREEILVVTGGRATVSLGEERAIASLGDVVVVPPDTRFELRVEGDEPFEALVCFPVGGEARLPDGTAFTPPWAQ